MKKSILQEGARSKGRVEPDHWWDKQHSLVLRQTPRWAQFFVLGLVVLSTGAITASSIIRIDEVITVNGKLVPTTGSQDVKTPAGGLINEVLVKDGDFVEKNEVLVKFDTRKAVEQLNRMTNQKNELTKTYKSRIRSLEERKKIMEKKYDTNVKIYQRLLILKDNGAIEENTMLRQEDETLELKGQILQINEQLLQTKSDYVQKRDDIKSQIFLNNLQIQYETVRAPKSGLIFESAASTKGVLSAGQVIMKIIPQDKLKADVWVTNKDIGYIKIGQKANVRIDAFDYTEFGDIDGKISSIGADVMPPDKTLDQYKYPVQITLEKNHLSRKEIKVPIITGMSITANIKLRDKRLISVVSDIFGDNRDALNQLRQ